jgi:hypothetical protein
MSIKRTIITTIVALALVAVAVPAVNAQTPTVADLMAQLAALQAQLATLQGSTSTPVPTGAVACNGVTFTRALTVGSTGEDVKCLQVLLNANGYTLATTGAGSPGMETSYFGPITLTAVRAFQVAKGWTPANQVGPLTRAALNALIGTTPVTPVTTLPVGCTSTSGFSPVTGVSCATGTTVVVPTGSITATLASDNPPAGALIGSQASADLLHINFLGTGTVTSVTLQRSGISDQNLFTNVYLYDGNTRISDGYSFNVSGQLVMNGLNIVVNGSHTISVRGDIMASASGSQGSAVVSLTNYTANGSAMSANVTGNMMSVVSGTLATVYLAANTMASTATINAGTSQYTFWTDSLQVNTRSVLLKTANFRMIGSAPSDALSNIKLFIDGVDTGKVASLITITGSNYASFDLVSAPITLTTGTHTIDVRADVEKGTNRTIQMSIQQASDLMVSDPQVGVNIAVLGASGAAFSANSGTTVTISWGTVTVSVDPTFTSQTDVTSSASNAVIGRYVLHAYGEDVKVSSLQVTPLIESATSTGDTCTTDASGATVTGACGLNNVTLYFNGSQVGSSSNWTHALMAAATPITFTLGSQMIAPAGQDSIVEVRADLQTAASVAYTGGTVKVTLVADTDNAYGQSSNYIVGVPTANQSTTGLTISTATLSVSKSTAYGNQTVSPSTAGVKIGSYILQNQSTSEAVRLTTLTVNLTTDGTTAMTSSTTPALTNFSALRTSDTTGSGSTPIQPTASNTFSVSDVLQPGASMVIDIFANTSSATSGDVVTRLTVASIGVSSNISSAGTIQTGQTISLGTGTLSTPTLVVSSTTPAQYIAAAGGATNATQATFNFVSTSGASTITELKFTVSDAMSATAQTVTSICVGSVCGSPVSGVVTLTGLSLAVPNGGGGLTQNVQVSYAPVGTSGITPGDTTYIYMTSVKSVSGGTTSTDTVSVAAPTLTMVGSKPAVTVATGGNTGMILGASTKVGQVTVTADAKGDIKVRTLTFNIGYSGYTVDPSATSAEFIALGGQSVAIAGSSCSDSSSATVETCTLGSTYATDFTIAAGQSQQFDLYVTNSNGSNTTAGSIARISSSLTSAGFVWDDTSTNGGSGSVALTGGLIYGFPTNSYSVSQ